MELSTEDAEDIRRIARRFAGRYPYPEEDDLVQEGLIRAYDVIEGIDASRGTRRAYLRTCVNNRFRDIVRKEIRRAKRQQPLDDRHGGIACPRAADPSARLVGRELMHEVARAAVTLPPAEASVVTLMLQGAEDAAITEITGRSANAISTARSHAVRRLRRALTADRAA